MLASKFSAAVYRMSHRLSNSEEKYPTKIKKITQEGEENLVSGYNYKPLHGKTLERTGSSSSNVLEYVKVRCFMSWVCA